MKYVFNIVFYFVIAFTPLMGQVPDSVKFRSLKPHDFYNQYKVTDSAILLDVREFFEFRSGRIKNAINIPSSGNLELTADTMNKNLSLFLYCYSGGRSSKAARIFYDKGFRRLYNLEGGITAWKKDNMPVVKGRVRRKKVN